MPGRVPQTPGSRQLDYWLGDWKISGPGAGPNATSRVYLAARRMHGRGGVGTEAGATQGRTCLVTVPTTKSWHGMFVDSQGRVHVFVHGQGCTGICRVLRIQSGSRTETRFSIESGSLVSVPTKRSTSGRSQSRQWRHMGDRLPRRILSEKTLTKRWQRHSSHSRWFTKPGLRQLPGREAKTTAPPALLCRGSSAREQGSSESAKPVADQSTSAAADPTGKTPRFSSPVSRC